MPWWLTLQKRYFVPGMILLTMTVVTILVVLEHAGFLFRWTKLPRPPALPSTIVRAYDDALFVQSADQTIAVWTSSSGWGVTDRSRATRDRGLAIGQRSCQTAVVALNSIARPPIPFRDCVTNRQYYADGYTEFVYVLDAYQDVWQWSYTTSPYSPSPVGIGMIVGGGVGSLISGIVVISRAGYRWYWTRRHRS